MKKQPKQKWYKVWSEAVLFATFIFLCGGAIAVGIGAGKDLYEKASAAYHEHFPPEKSPGELVDLAMALPGAIVLTPHRDLIEVGIRAEEIDAGGNHVPVYLTSPAIAIHTKKNWCILELGWNGYFSYDRDFEKKGGYLLFENITEVGSADGYQAAYDIFTKCVKDGNAK